MSVSPISLTRSQPPMTPRFYDILLQLRAIFLPEDDEGFTRPTAWQRPNPFSDSV